MTFVIEPAYFHLKMKILSFTSHYWILWLTIFDPLMIVYNLEDTKIKVLKFASRRVQLSKYNLSYLTILFRKKEFWYDKDLLHSQYILTDLSNKYVQITILCKNERENPWLIVYKVKQSNV